MDIENSFRRMLDYPPDYDRIDVVDLIILILGGIF